MNRKVLRPIYAENIIVAVVYKNIFRWYISDKELWFMDYSKMDYEYDNLGYCSDEQYEIQERKGIKILRTENAQDFLNRIEKYSTCKADLYKLLQDSRQMLIDENDILSFAPSLYIDFDNQILYSMYPEPASYEEYVPQNWIGLYEDFTALIPENQKYWIDNCGKSLFII